MMRYKPMVRRIQQIPIKRLSIRKILSLVSYLPKSLWLNVYYDIIKHIDILKLPFKGIRKKDMLIKKINSLFEVILPITIICIALSITDFLDGFFFKICISTLPLFIAYILKEILQYSKDH